MFSALSQGNLVYILDKADGVKFKVGEVIGTTVPQFSADGSGMVIKLSIKVDGNVVEYNNIPSTSTIVTYNTGKLVIAETKQAIQSEVEATLHNAQHIIEHIDDYKVQAEQCEIVLKEINPQFAKDKARDEEIQGLKEEVSSIRGDIAKILEAVTKT